MNVEKCGWNIIKNSLPRDDIPGAAKIRRKVHAYTQMQARDNCDELGEVWREKCEWNIVLN